MLDWKPDDRNAVLAAILDAQPVNDLLRASLGKAGLRGHVVDHDHVVAGRRNLRDHRLIQVIVQQKQPATDIGQLAGRAGRQQGKAGEDQSAAYQHVQHV